MTAHDAVVETHNCVSRQTSGFARLDLHAGDAKCCVSTLKNNFDNQQFTIVPL